MFGEGWSRHDTQDFIKRCYDRNVLLESLLGFAGNWLDAALIGLISKDKTFIQRGAGKWSTVVGQVLPGTGPLQRALQLGGPSLHSPAALSLQEFIKPFPGLSPQSLLVLPLSIGGRAVVVLVGCPAPGQVELAMFQDIFDIAQLVATQLEEIILLAKSGALPPAGERVPPAPIPAPRLEAATQQLAAIRVQPPSDDDEMLGFSSVSEPYPEALKGRAEKTPPPISLFSDRPASRTISMGELAQPTSARSEGVLDEQDIRSLPRTPFDDESSAPSQPIQPPAKPPVKPLPAIPAPPQHAANHAPGSTHNAPPRAGHDFNRDETSGVSIMPPQTVGQDSDGSKKTLMGGFSVVDVMRARQEAERELAEQRANMRQTLNGGFSPVAAVQPAQPAPAAQIIKPNRRREESEARDEAPSVVQQRQKLAASTAATPATPAPQAVTRPTPSVAVRLDVVAEQLDSRDARQVADALQVALAQPGGHALIERIFPGRLLVDRYQHTAETMPPVEEHGPLLAAATTGDMDELLAALLTSSSLEKRFYATLLLTKRSPSNLLAPLRERLFDRDLQTRQLARLILLSARHEPSFQEDVLAPLRTSLASNDDELQVESAAELLGQAHDRGSVEILIDILEQHRGRTQQTILFALQRITLQPLPGSAFSWRTWWKMAQREERREWILRALNASAEPIRELVAIELQRIPNLSLHYHPRLPPAIRIRAQQQLKSWFEANPGLAAAL
jgi:hypothetical protein